MRIENVGEWIHSLPEHAEVAVVTNPEKLTAGECGIGRLGQRCSAWVQVVQVNHRSVRRFNYDGTEKGGNGRLVPVTLEVRSEVLRRAVLEGFRSVASDSGSLEAVASRLLSYLNEACTLLRLEVAPCPRCRRLVRRLRSKKSGERWFKYSCCGHKEPRAACPEAVAA